MKQDKDLTKKILVTMVESDEVRLNTNEVHRRIGMAPKAFSTTCYHLQLLEDEGYIVHEGEGPLSGYRVTAQGQARYDWYGSNRDPFATA